MNVNETNLMPISKHPLSDTQSLRDIVSQVKAVMHMATGEDLLFAKSVDCDLISQFYELVAKRCVKLTSKEKSLIDSSRRLFGGQLYLLKQYYKIPRPYVLAERLSIELPRKNLISKSGVGYSYPSIHAGESRFVAHLISRKYADCLGDMGRHEIFNHANRIAMSRVHMGVHSLQDIREGIRLADAQFTA
jgi:hypothetical protein